MPTKTGPMGPGLSDVAASAKVSIATVSRVLTGKANVAEEARARVLEAVRHLNYKPLRRPKQSLQARHALGEGVKPTIAYLCHDEYATGMVKWSASFAAASRRLQESNCRLTMHFPPIRGANDVQPARLPETFNALIAVDRGDEIWHRTVSSANVPAVRIGYNPIDLTIPQLVGDNFNGTLKAMEYLLGKGHRRIGVWRARAPVAEGAPRNLNEREKYAAYRFALDEAGIEFQKNWEIDIPFDPRHIPAGAKELLAVKPGVTALFVDNDWMLSRFQTMQPSGDLPAGWYRQFELAHFIDLGKEPAEYGVACAALPMDTMGELAASLLLEQLAGHRFGPDLLIKVMPTFYTAEQVAERAKKIV